MSNYIDFRDPSETYADLEFEASFAQLNKMKKTVETLNDFMDKNGWNISFKVGKHIGIFGDFIISSGESSFASGKHTHKFTLHEDAYSQRMIMVIENVMTNQVISMEQEFQQIMKDEFFLDVSFKYENNFNILNLGIGKSSSYGAPEYCNKFNEFIALVKKYQCK